MSNFKTFIYQDNQTPNVRIVVQASDLENSKLFETLTNELDQLFSHHKQLKLVTLASDDPQVNQRLAQVLPVINGELHRDCFYQLPLRWHRHKTSTQFPKRLVQSNDQYRHHPLRPSKPEGCVYKRYDADADLDVSFRTIDIDKDLAQFTRWMNDPRVANFWEQAWSEEKLAEFLQERIADPHIIPLIGEFNGQAFGYVEAYWVAEDRLSPYFDVQDFDRGIHLLVGEQQFRGPKFFNAWMKGISHYLFIDDARTQRIVLEPRADNQRLFNRILPFGYEKCFEFNFPHKRSALLMLNRDRFFSERW